MMRRLLYSEYVAAALNIMIALWMAGDWWGP